jgi:hypothetical protein
MMSPISDAGWGRRRAVSTHSVKIAQRFNAGLRSPELSKSRQGRQNRRNLVPLLSSLTGLGPFYHIIFPALKRWAIFAADGAARRPYPSATERDSLRLAS